ncbi:hypothetical protein C0992_002665, partial [Termitomyces sp. T32_za158]
KFVSATSLHLMMSTTTPSSALITFLQQQYEELKKEKVILRASIKKDKEYLEKILDKMEKVEQELKEKGGTLVPVAAPGKAYLTSINFFGA